jgi:hypothetical protein
MNETEASMNKCHQGSEMMPTEDTPLTAEQFLVESGLLRRWMQEQFKYRLKEVAANNSLVLWAVRQRGGCLQLWLYYPQNRLPSRKPKLRIALHRLFRETGYRVPGRALRYRVGTRRPNVVVVYAAPDYQ